MSTPCNSLAERVQSSYLQLSSVASELNSVSDELGKSITEIDAALKALNLGVAVWVPINGGEDGPFYWSEDIGYAKIGPRWGLGLRTISGNYAEEEERGESWLFNEGPRILRLAAIEKLPNLLAALSREASENAKNIRTRLAEVKEIAAAVKAASEGTSETERRVIRRVIARGPDAEVKK